MILFENSSCEVVPQQGSYLQEEEDFFGLPFFEEPGLARQPDLQEPLHVFHTMKMNEVKHESMYRPVSFQDTFSSSQRCEFNLASQGNRCDIFAPLPISQEQAYVQERKAKRELVKRRRSLDDECRLKEIKRERAEQAQLTHRRRSLDSGLKIPVVHNTVAPPKFRVVKRSNLWTFEEEVFLVAAVMECFLRRGSLTSNKGRDGCWKDIKLYFDLFLGNYNKMNNKKKAANRLSSALYRHFKTLKERIAKDPTKDLREYYTAFLTRYNVNGCLFNGSNQ